jgi:hypothetical protein
MKSEKQQSLKPLDIVVALQLTLAPETTFSDLAAAVGISHGEAHKSVGRLQASRLTRPGRRAVSSAKLMAFISAGVPIAFPATFGAESRGVPTAHSAPPFLSHVSVDADPLVWADPEGPLRGASLVPLFPKASALARSNVPLYELLTLVDSIRIARARESDLATDLLRERIMGSADSENASTP